MSKKSKVKLLLALLALCISCCALALFAGCIGEQTAEDFLNNRDARHQQVTYYGNGGLFNNTQNIKEKNIYYRADDYVILDFSTVSNLSIARDNYVFAGWYYAELDEDGKPVYEDEQNRVVKMSANRVEDGLKIPADTHLYICANWEEDIQLKYVLVSDGPITVKENGEDVTKQSGDVIFSKHFVGSSASVGTNAPVASSDYTFLQCYLNEECTTPAGSSFQKPTGEDAKEKAVVYAKYIPGVWTVVKSVSDVEDMFFELYQEKQFYILNDIDCATASFSVKAKSSNTNCYIEGNGKTLSNLSFATTSVSAGGSYSIFGTFGANAKISNLTLDGVSVSYSTRSTPEGLFFFCSGDNGAEFINFTIKNAAMKVSHANNVYIPNIQLVNDVYVADNWLFGNVEADANYAKHAQGQLVINGQKLTVQNVVAAEIPAVDDAQ